jgi:signal transduction histidine kinase
MRVPAAGTRRGSATAAPRALVLSGVALGGCAAAAGSFAVALRSDHVNEPGLQAALMDWITLPYVLCGVFAWWRRPGSPFGRLMIAAGFAAFLSTLSWSNAPALHTLGQAFDLVPAVLFLHVFLAFPAGRLGSPVARGLVAAGYVIAFGLELAYLLIGGLGSDNVLELVHAPGAADVLQKVQLVALSALLLAGIGVLAARRRRAARPLRRPLALMVDFFALGLVMIAWLFVTGAFDGPAFETVRRATFVVLGIAPVAFVIGLLNTHLARAAVAGLVVKLRANPEPHDLRDALARALHDPTLRLAYWLPEFGSWADLDGREIELPTNGDRAMTLIGRDGAHVAALVHDPSLDDEAELLDAVSAAAGIALENGRLQVELRARLEELKGSRVRVIAAAQKERERLERDLHDGAQQRLVALSLELSLLQRKLADDAEATVRVARARREIARSLDELRDVARGLHPAVVTGHGLPVALQSLAARAPVPVRLTVELDDRLPESIEVAAYYVVCESLANIGKHAHATAATIGVARADGVIVVEVGDDGVGGADADRGTGLRGLADRVEALGGRLRVRTASGSGTQVLAEIPCGR